MSFYKTEEDFDRLLMQLKRILVKCESSDSDARAERYAEALLVLERTKCVQDAYLAEIEKLKPQTRQTQLNRFADKQKQLNEYNAKVQVIGEQVQEQEQASLGKAKSVGNSSYTHKLVAWGDEIQDKTAESIGRIRALTVQSERIGNDVTLDLEQQTESLTRIKSTIGAVDENIIAANVTLKFIAKGLLRERFTLVLLLSITLLTAGTVLLLVFRP